MIQTKNNKQQPGLDTSARPWLYASITITILLIGILVWHLVYSYNLLTSFKNKEFVIEQSSWQLRLNAETMRLSALVSASTGNLKWKKTYQKTRENLKPNLRQIRELIQSRKVDRLTAEVQKHLEIITDIEDQAFALVRQGEKKEAFKLLSGWKYTKNQRKFSDKIKVLVEAIHERLEQAVSFGTTRMSLLVVFGGLVILFFLWTVTLKTWRIQNREKLAAKNAQRQSENYYRTVFETSGTAMCILEDDITISQINANFEEFTGYSKQEIEGKKFATEFVHPDDMELIKENHYLRRQDPDKSPRRYEFRFMNRQSEVRNIDLFVDMIPGTAQTIVSGIDITERKQMEQELKEMSLHDSLTGLYNRNFFEEEMKRLSDGRYNPLGILVCDLDGLKFINDTLGHQDGDRVITIVSGILQRNFRSSDIIARIGGDEFAVLLPNTPRNTVQEKVDALRRAVQDYNNSEPEIPISLSVGHAVNEEGATDTEALFREADNRMYREKMQREESACSDILQALIDSMQARDFDTEGHCDRLQELAVSLGGSLQFSQELINDLSLLTRFHDLGKVGIPDHILFKPGPLTEEEWQQMRQHCEIGYRIASSVSDLVPIAEYILKHHEWWDGRGYPLGLSGEDIPLLCRVLAIVDAYDAMTSDRPYRGAMTNAEAIEELKRSAGTQFDPELVHRFIRILEESKVKG